MWSMWTAVVRVLVGAACVPAVAGCGWAAPDTGGSRPAPDAEGPRLSAGTGGPRSAPDTGPPEERPPRWVPKTDRHRWGSETGRPRSSSRDQARPACRGPCATVAVVRVIDGDTVVLQGLGRVRLIGLDAPETWLRHDCMGTEATQALRALTPPGSPVHTAGDSEPRDHYGRRLLYLWTPSGEFVNATLVREGLARAMPIPPDTSYAPFIHAAEDTARHRRAGIWHPNLAKCTPPTDRPDGGEPLT